MATINQLNALGAPSESDLVPVYSQQNGDARKLSLGDLKDFVLADDADAGGILGISSLYSMRKTVSSNVSVGTSYGNIANWDGQLIAPSGRDSLSLSQVLGEWVATRDISHVMMYANLSGSWPSNRDLTLAILIGTDAAPYESSVKFIGAGRGAGNPVTASFAGPGANLNNGGNVIRAGEKIRLVAKFNTADTLAIERAVFTVQTLDGI
jgi:hypothetical protein